MRRAILATLLLAAGALLVALLAPGDGGYVVRAELHNAGGLRPGFHVRIDGVPVGTVTDVGLGIGDRAIVSARIDAGAAPLGRDARATVRAASLLGEKYLDVSRGDTRAPLASGSLIPVARTGVAVELDDVLNTLDLPTRAALDAVLNETGLALDGRGGDVARLLEELPHGLDGLGRLAGDVAHDTRALGRLVEESDRVVGAVAGERRELGRLVSGAATTMTTLAGDRRQLDATVRRAPGTLATLRDALAALEGAAVPLAPAARGLRATAPSLTAALRELPATAAAAAPTLRSVRAAVPALDRLARQGTPPVRHLRPLARELRAFADGADPALRSADDTMADVLGVLEGWARATAARDTAGHVFRLDPIVGSPLLNAVLGEPRARRRPPRATKPAQPAPAAATPKPDVRAPRLPALRAPELPALPRAQDTIKNLLDFLLEP